MSTALDRPPKERRRAPRAYVALIGDQLDVLIGEERLALYDLSLIGFSAARPSELPKEPFLFTIRSIYDSQLVVGQAVVRNTPTPKRIGCEILSLEPNSFDKLLNWLIAYVLRNARVPLPREDAEAIVRGFSQPNWQREKQQFFER